jgi:hypothetical protein
VATDLFVIAAFFDCGSAEVVVTTPGRPVPSANRPRWRWKVWGLWDVPAGDDQPGRVIDQSAAARNEPDGSPAQPSQMTK